MKIMLTTEEIEEALVNFVGNQGITITGKKTEVTLIAGRAPNGMTASIDITGQGESVSCKNVVSGDGQLDLPFADCKSADETGPMPDATDPVADFSKGAENAAEADEETLVEEPLFGKS